MSVSGAIDRPRFDLARALEAVRGRGPVLILPHDNPDPDALAAAMGLARLVEEVGCQSTIALGGIIGRAENRAFVNELGVRLEALEVVHLDRYPLIALVDTQPGTGNNSLPPGRHADIVIDHHPARLVDPPPPWYDVREEVGVSSAIVLEYLREAGVRLDSQLATAFLYAIKSETRDLGREGTPMLRATYLTLFAEADHDRLYRITHPKLGRQHFAAVDCAIRAAEVRGPLVSADLGALAYPDLVAEVADLLLSFEGARWVLCVGHHAGRVYLSIRTDVPQAHAGQMMRDLIGIRGSGGGHGMIAGGRLHALDLDASARAEVYAELVAHLGAQVGAPTTAEPLLPR